MQENGDGSSLGDVLKPQRGRRSFCSGGQEWENGASDRILVASWKNFSNK